jgi:MarR family transcriptional regulator, organic hydroperoxide resistance regulator
MAPPIRPFQDETGRGRVFVSGPRRRADRAQSPVQPDLGYVLDFMQLVWALSHGLQATSKHMERDLGISGPQRLVIRIIGEMPGTSAGRLAGVLRVHPSTLTGVLWRLEQRGWIRRRTAREDRRRAQLTLTPRGIRVNASSEGTVEAAVSRMLDRLPSRTVKAGRRVLAAIAEELAAGQPARPVRLLHRHAGGRRPSRVTRRVP